MNSTVLYSVYALPVYQKFNCFLYFALANFHETAIVFAVRIPNVPSI